jgi:hypothetical protein
VDQFDRFPDWKTPGSARLFSGMMGDCWVETLKCPNCRKTGFAVISQTHELSWDMEADFVPTGFKVTHLKHGIIFYFPAGGIKHARSSAISILDKVWGSKVSQSTANSFLPMRLPLPRKNLVRIQISVCP